MGKLFIISAPSGAGKTTLTKALVAQNDKVVMSVSHTTRAQRSGEKEAEDYYFVNKTAFFSMVDQGLFLEYAQVYDNYYGTSRCAVKALLKKGVNVILDIDWQGAREVRKQMPDAISVSILPPSLAVLEKRLTQRNSDTKEVIARRMSQAINEISHCEEADFLVVNDVFQQALDELTLVLCGEADKIVSNGCSVINAIMAQQNK